MVISVMRMSGIEVEEFAEPRREPVHADARRGRDLEVAVRPLAAVGQLGARRLELHEHFMRGAVKQLALLGEDQPARMAVEQRHRQAPARARETCRDTADCDSPSCSPAWVKLPASAAA